MPSTEAFCHAVHNTLVPHANEANAPKMQAYMKHHFSFLGIPTPARRALILPLLRAQKESSAEQLLAHAAALWAMPHREYQYVAIDLLACHHRAFSHEYIEAFLTLAQQKSWWDSVDGLAGIVGDILKKAVMANPSTQELMDVALQHSHLWVRRIAMIHQLGWREHTDAQRLFSYARSLAHERDFFIRKAIGWALRDYAKHDEDKVYAFIVEMRSQLSPLSFREASRHIARV